MNEKTLMDFITKIIANTKGNDEKTKNVLGELKKILESQNAEARFVSIVQKTIDSIPEIYDWASNDQIYSSQIDRAYMRAEGRREEERRRREAELRSQGRC